MADIKFSEFPKANTSKDSDELAILQDGVNKMIASPILESKIINKTVSRVIDQGGASLNVINLKGVVPTYADLATITPTPELNDAYQVEADGLVYVYTENGFQSDGDGFKVQPNVNGVVEEGNTQAVSGGEVFDKTASKEVVNEIKEIQDVFLEYSSGEIEVEKIGQNDGESYGYAFDYKGWGFAGEAFQNIKSITINIGIRSAITQYRLIVRENNLQGAVLSDTTNNLSIGVQTRYNLVHTFDTPLANTNNAKLYYEIYANGAFYVYRKYPTNKFTEENGYAKMANATMASDMGITRVQITPGSVYAGVDHSVYIIENLEIYDFTQYAQDRIKEIFETDEYLFTLTNENIKTSLVGSSVTWGDGYLQSGYVNNLIYKMQSQVATSILPEVFDFGTMLNNRKYYNSRALKLDGIGEEIEFELTGNEVSIVQSIERSNVNASEIEIYIDDILHDTFNNFNPTEIGSETKTFTATGTSTYFDLGRAFTYNHTVTINGVSKVVVMNMIQGVGFTIPSNADCAIIRKLGTRADGTTNVNHFLWLKNTPTNGDEIVITYDYGEELFYEKTTIGSDSVGNNECPYGDGAISFDTTNPSSMASGLDFRQTDDRVVKTYRFLDAKTRKVKLRIKGNYNGSTGTPYFIFNFATNRYFHFQNAGIGGWQIWEFEKNISNQPTRGWQRVVEFQPNIMIYETTPNDDWQVKGHKLYKEQTLTLAQLRNLRTLPLREIQYNSGDDNYTVSKWQGLITAITETSVTFDATISTPIVKGDVVIIGEYYSRNDEYFERVVDSVDGNTIYFNNPLNVNDVVFSELDDFIGKGIVVRSYDLYSTKIQAMLDNVQDSLPSAKIGLLENPMPNCLARELWGYPLILDKMSKDNQFVNSINYLSLREWQNSQTKTKFTVNTSYKVFDEVLGKYYIPFGANGQNVLGTDILQNGISIYGSKAVVQNGWAYVVNQSATGSTLNKSIANPTNTGQVHNGKQPRVILFDDTITGVLTVQYSSNLWSADSCHMNNNSAQLYADFLKDFLFN